MIRLPEDTTGPAGMPPKAIADCRCPLVSVYSRGVPIGAGPIDPPATNDRPGSKAAEELTMATAIDPVCGMEVETDDAPYTAEHEGTTYYFCGKGCLLDFKEDPGKFLAPDYRPGMDHD